MAIIKQYHKDTDTTYVYESTSYWDPEKKQARSTRKCIGRIDPETGEIIPTGKRGRKKEAEPVFNDAISSKLTQELDKARADILTLKAQNAELSAQVSELTKENQQLTSIIIKIRSLSNNALA
jgi:hypothetical protein